MRLKILFGILFIILLCATIFTAAALRSRNDKSDAPAKRAVQAHIGVVQLPVDRGIIPVAIQGEKISVNPANGVMEMVFAVKNNTGKNIDAISVSSTVMAENNGREFSSTGYFTQDSLGHPDIREIHHQRALAPGAEWSFGPEPLEFENGVVLKEIKLQIDYVEFKDKTVLGPNKYGSNVVAKQRTGAAKYKAWLAKKYAENGRSVSPLVPLLDRNQALPVEIEFGDHERTGAKRYRSHLLEAYQRYGPSEVEKYLNR
jgi:hypothetical protein